jgi:hypothetical protein
VVGLELCELSVLRLDFIPHLRHGRLQLALLGKHKRLVLPQRRVCLVHGSANAAGVSGSAKPKAEQARARVVSASTASASQRALRSRARTCANAAGQ